MPVRVLMPFTLVLWHAVALPAADLEPLWNVRIVSSGDDGHTGGSAATNPELTVSGRVLVEAADGGILLEDRAGRLWNVTPAELLERAATNDRFEPFARDELAEALLAELGDRFQIVTTEHYVIATSGNRVHAEWCGTLLERLLEAFLRYWRTAGLELSPPAAPLAVVIHAARDEYTASAAEEGGAALSFAHGYYSMRTNRVVLADVTTAAKSPVRTTADVQRLIAADPSPASTVAHEGTHQIAFNSGMHTRYADNPVWLTEGVAMLFEIPDLTDGGGWRTIGRVNRPRLNRFRQSLREGRPPDALSQLIADDERFRNAATVEAAYGEAWVLASFLVKTHRREFVAFVTEYSDNSRLLWKTRNERLADFERFFGSAPEGLDSELLRYARRIR